MGDITFIEVFLSIVAACILLMLIKFVWRLLKQATEKLPDSLESAAKVSGKTTRQASVVGNRLKKAFAEGRKE